ncbi:MAG: cytolytic delta-endotoxin (insecticidal protein) [Saprospiraceae bacterium]
MVTEVQNQQVAQRALYKNFPSRVVILTSDKDELKFESIFAIKDPKAAKPAFEMSKFFTKFVSDDLTLDMSAAVEAIKKSENYAIIETLDTTKEQRDNSVSAMVEQLQNLFKNVLDIALSAGDVDKIRASIEDAFVNLAPQEGDAWIFWKKQEAHKTVYQYNILFAVQNAETGLFLYGLPISMEISADLDKEQVLFITLKDKVSYRVHVQSIKVITFIEDALAERAFRKLLASAAY